MVIAPPLEGAPAARPPHRDPLRALVAPATWLAAAHLLLDAAVGVASALVLGMGLFLSVVLLPVPLLGLADPADGTIAYGIPFVDNGGGRALLAGLGLVLLLAAPTVLRALAAADAALARTLLGPVPEVLARRVDELERSRARVVDA